MNLRLLTPGKMGTKNPHHSHHSPLLGRPRKCDRERNIGAIYGKGMVEYRVTLEDGYLRRMNKSQKKDPKRNMVAKKFKDRKKARGKEGGEGGGWINAGGGSSGVGEINK